MKSFKKGEILTADRLNELITSATDASAAPGRTVPPRPGIHAQPGLARFNMQVEDSCTGQVSPLPDYAGLLKSVVYDSLDAPVINRGNIILPLAHDYSPEDSSLPDESATGGMRGVQVTAGLQRPMINRGLLGLPLAQSSWPQTAEGAMYTPGLVYGVQYDPADDACEGAVLPRIDQGIIHLPAPTSGGDDDACTGSCSCPLAQANTSSTVPGLMTGLEVGSSYLPEIVDGVAYLPLAQWGESVHYTKANYGLVRSIDLNGGKRGFIIDGDIHAPWALQKVMPADKSANPYGIHLLDLDECSWCPVTMSECTLTDGTTLYLNAWSENGALCLQLSTNQYYSS